MPWIAGLTVRVLTHERAHVGRRLLVDAVLDLVRDKRLAGATVTRALEGLSDHGVLRQSSALEVGDDLPVVIEIVDRTDRIEPLLPEIAALVVSGALTVAETRLYLPASRLRVRDMMTPPHRVVHPETPLREALGALIDEGVRLIPVVGEDGKLKGVLTLGQVFADVEVELGRRLLERQSSEQVRSHLEQVIAGKSARDRMLTHPFLVAPEMSLEEAGRYLTRHHVTRVPVVEGDGRLVGVISEARIVLALVAPQDDSNERSAAAPTFADSSLHAMLRLCVLPGAGEQFTAAALADRDVPLIPVEAPWDTVVRAIQSTSACLALVVAPDGQLRGVIDERSLLERAAPGLPSASRSALRRIFTRSPGRVVSVLHSRRGQYPNAAGLMRESYQRVPAAMPIAEALARMIEAQRSDVAVVTGEDGAPLGVLWRDDALSALLTSNPSVMFSAESERDGQPH